MPPKRFVGFNDEPYTEDDVRLLHQALGTQAGITPHDREGSLTHLREENIRNATGQRAVTALRSQPSDDPASDFT